MSTKKHHSAQATLPVVEAPEEVMPTFESATAEQLYNAGETLKQIAAQSAHLEKQIASKEQEIETLSIPVASAEQVVNDLAEEIVQIVLRLRYARQKATIAGSSESSAKEAVAAIEKEQAEKEQEQRAAQISLDQARTNYDVHLAATQSEIAALRDELTQLEAQSRDFTDLQRDLHAHLGMERMEALRSQIDTANEVKARYLEEIATANDTIEHAQSLIAQDLADWPELRKELEASHGKIEAQHDSVTRILDAWLHYVDVLHANGKDAATRPLPQDVTQHQLAAHLPIGDQMTMHLMYRDDETTNVRNIKHILASYRLKNHLPAEAR